MRNRSIVVRLVAMLALAFGLVGVMASPASAQDFSGPCQVVGSDGIEQGNEEECTAIVTDANAGECEITVGDDTFQTIDGCAEIQQGECPGQIITEDNTIIQFICDGDDEPTATTAPGTETPTTVPGTETPTTVPGTETPTEVPTQVPTDTDTDTDTDDGGQGEDPVDELPSTGQGPDNGESSSLPLVLGAMSMLMAIAAFAWQRRQTA